MTQYSIARNAQDYKNIHSYIRTHNETSQSPLGFPTILAYDNGKPKRVKGFIATSTHKKVVMIDQIMAESPIVAFRLIEKYDILMQKLGITEYLIPVDKDDEKLKNTVARLFDIIPSYENDRYFWFKKEN